MIMMMIGLFSQRAWTTASSYEQNPSLGFKSSMFGILIFSSHDSRPPAAKCHLLKIKQFKALEAIDEYFASPMWKWKMAKEPEALIKQQTNKAQQGIYANFQS